MINIRELRLGNYVMYEQTTHVVTSIIRTLIETHWHGRTESYTHLPHELDPIPLTEEMLLKCGFVQEKGVMSYILDEYPSIKIVYETLAAYYRLYPYTYKIKYLHQLQNLFFAITGKELEYE